MTILALILTAGLLARFLLNLHRENVALRQARSRTASAIIRLRRQRAAYAKCLELAGDEFEEEHERAEALEEELRVYRAEDARVVVRRVQSERLN